jgi:hypothetical protein
MRHPAPPDVDPFLTLDFRTRCSVCCRYLPTETSTGWDDLLPQVSRHGPIRFRLFQVTGSSSPSGVRSLPERTP